MRKSKRINAFLLLGVMLLTLVISGCTPQQQAEPSETKPGTNTIAFHEIIRMNQIRKIRIISSDDEVICILEDHKAISKFQLAFEDLTFKQVSKIAAFTSSFAVYETQEFTECKEHIETAYRVEIELTDDAFFGFYIGRNHLVYYINESEDYYISTETTKYISEELS